MPSNWREVVVSQLASDRRNALVGGPFGSNLVSSDYVASGVPVIRGQNMGPGRWVSGPFAYVSMEKARSLSANLARPGDLVFTQRGQAVLEGGQVAIVPPEPFSEYLVSQSQMKLSPNTQIADPLYLLYFFSSPRHAEYLRGHAIQTGVPHTNLGILAGTPLPLPPLDEQRAIAHTLGTLDDKIELNWRITETLEAMARALFKSWFIDFDPVRAKVAGRTPVGMDPATASLFPAMMENGHPILWTLRPYAEGVTVTKGKSYKSEDLLESATALVTLKSFLRGGGYREDGLKAYAGEYKPEQVILPGELVVAFTDVTQAAEVIGKPALVRSSSRFPTLVASLDVGIVRSRVAELPIEYLYYRFLDSEFQEHTYAHSNGSTVLHLASDAITKYEGIWPSRPCADAFRRVVRPLIDLQNANWSEASTLVALRDLLLPKLLSGELRVRDAEREVEKVA